MFLIRILTLIALMLPAAAHAQDFPEYKNTYVNDFAGLLSPGENSRITSALKTLREGTGIEATVLTLETRNTYRETGRMEAFATDLFNHWGIGDKEKNDGILIMVLRSDREMRIELGQGYNAGFNRVAKDIIEDVMLPKFRANAYGPGIELGTLAVIERIARVQAAGQDAPIRRDPEAFIPWIMGGVFGIIGFFMIFGRKIFDRVRRCPSCGERGIHTTRDTLTAATRSTTGEGQETVSCTHCGYHNVSRYTIARRSSSTGGGSFGGGSSSGGGASGRW